MSIDLNKILLLDKPINITSNAALQTVKKLCRVRKAGHTGSLDPLACGMLPICFGEATKFSQYLLEADKHYRVIAKLGIATTTGDAEGEVIASHTTENLTQAKVEAVLVQFRGQIEQVPSMYSALKHKGQPLYKLARQGIEVERKPRQITIHKLTLLEYSNTQLTLEISCSKGTYVRTLVTDMGAALQCGAHVAYLRRLRVGSFAAEQMVTLEALRTAIAGAKLAKHLLPIEAMLTHWPVVTLSKTAGFYLRRGQAVRVADLSAIQLSTTSWVSLYSFDGYFMGVGEIMDDGRVAPRRLLRNVRS